MQEGLGGVIGDAWTERLRPESGQPGMAAWDGAAQLAEGADRGSSE